ncbi:MAG TPA: hypothetical protein VFB16_01410 [Bauldia sp.]|nr:hypothetical protein [Bauldia sp.]
MATGQQLDVIRFSYTGGLADSGRLNFYELGRAYYAASRLTYTIARFRETGRVLQKISEKIDTVILAEAPRRGSFIIDAAATLVPIVVAAAVDAPLSAIFAWIWDKILPSSDVDKKDALRITREIAKINASRDVNLSKQETERLKVIERILTQEKATLRDLVDAQRLILRRSENASDGPSVRRESAKLESMTDLLQRTELIEEYEEAFSSINTDTERRLEERVRETMQDVALPLRSSADYIAIGTPANANLFARLDSQEVKNLNAEIEDRTVIKARCRIIRYDRNGRYGKLASTEALPNLDQTEYFFRLSSGASRQLHSNVIDAMHLAEVKAKLTAYRNELGEIQRLVLHDVDLSQIQ